MANLPEILLKFLVFLITLKSLHSMHFNAFYSKFSFLDSLENAVSEHLEWLNAYASGKIRCPSLKI